ncbi:inositol monophosphatase [Coprothermobacteraceae bacterium]|nr:inositol monophosphatase [Coprothermobacteraceae bacterium]
MALRAGALLKEGFRTSFERQEKSPHDLVTEYDLRSQELIIDGLRKAFPRCGFLSEEDAEVQGDPLFVIDPLDGTNNFAYGVPVFAVSIGVVEDGALTSGVVYNPAYEELFWAQAGVGAYLNERPIKVSYKALTESLVATAFPFKYRDKVEWFSKLFQQLYPHITDIRRMGAASLDMAYTAAGVFGAFYEYGLKPWDAAAGVVLVREAGGVVVDFEGRPYDPFASESLIAGSQANVDSILEIWHARNQGN